MYFKKLSLNYTSDMVDYICIILFAILIKIIHVINF